MARCAKWAIRPAYRSQRTQRAVRFSKWIRLGHGDRASTTEVDSRGNIAHGPDVGTTASWASLRGAPVASLQEINEAAATGRCGESTR